MYFLNHNWTRSRGILTPGSICAVHGLNGNAFDTFAWEGRDMWLRDFLPKPRSQYPELTRLRVMTFGYSSLVRDNKNITGLDEWCQGLLQSVSAVRRSQSVGVRRLSQDPRNRLELTSKGTLPPYYIRVPLTGRDCCPASTIIPRITAKSTTRESCVLTRRLG
jgi:hypothetical protein